MRAAVVPEPGRPPVIASGVQSPGRSGGPSAAAVGVPSATSAMAQLASRWARTRLQYGLIAVPSGVWISTWAWGTEPSELPESPIQAMTWPAVTGLPGSMPGAKRHVPSSAPSSPPGVSLLTW